MPVGCGARDTPAARYPAKLRAKPTSSFGRHIPPRFQFYPSPLGPSGTGYPPRATVRMRSGWADEELLIALFEGEVHGLGGEVADAVGEVPAPEGP